MTDRAWFEFGRDGARTSLSGGRERGGLNPPPELPSRQGEVIAGGQARPRREFRPSGAPIIVLVLLVSLLVPINIYTGELRLSAYRIILLATFVPVLLRFLMDSGLRFRWADALMFGYALTGGTSLLVTGSDIASSGIFILESLGPYMLARVYIRSADDFTTLARFLFWCVVATLPFALYENISGDPVILTTLKAYFSVLPDVQHEVRLGLDRAQVVLDHPILYGVFCAFCFAPVLYAASPRRLPRLAFLKAALVGVAVFTSLSSGAFVAVALQCLLVGWDMLTRSVRLRWKLLAVGLVSVATVLELGSNRTLAQISIGFLALNEHTAWSRILVNEYVLENIYQNFLFGIGLHGAWERPSWLTGSVDNFWLATALRYGVPTAALFLAAALAAFAAVARAPTDDAHVNACRKGLLIGLVGTGIAIITVHLWNSTYCLFILLIASGMWIAEHPKSERGAAGAPAADDRQVERPSRIFSALSGSPAQPAERGSVTAPRRNSAPGPAQRRVRRRFAER